MPLFFLKVHSDQLRQQAEVVLLPPQMKWISFSTWFHFMMGGWLIQFITHFLSQTVAVHPFSRRLLPKPVCILHLQLHSLVLAHCSLEWSAKCYHVWRGQMRAGEKKGGGGGGGGRCPWIKHQFIQLSEGVYSQNGPSKRHWDVPSLERFFKPIVAALFASAKRQTITNHWYKKIHISLFCNFMVKVWV